MGEEYGSRRKAAADSFGQVTARGPSRYAKKQEVDVFRVDVRVHEFRASHVIDHPAGDPDLDAKYRSTSVAARTHRNVGAVGDVAGKWNVPEQQARMAARDEPERERSDLAFDGRGADASLDHVDAVESYARGGAERSGRSGTEDPRPRAPSDLGNVEDVIEMRVAYDHRVGTRNMARDGTDVGVNV